MKKLPACLLLAGIFTVGCNDPNSMPTHAAGEAKGDPKEIMAALRQLGSAFLKFEESHGHMPAAAILSKDGKPLLSWRVAILPFIGQDELYKQFHLDEPWDSEHNKKLLPKMPKVYAPLRGPAPKEPNSTCCQVFTGPGAPFSLAARVGPKVTDFTDGLAQTFLIVEASQAVPWTKPADLVYDAKKPLPKLGFDDRVYVVLADGSSHFIKRTVPESIFRAAVTLNGEERDVLISDERSVLDKE
jgi:hypothetical protein